MASINDTVKKVIKFEAGDGTLFDFERDALAHNALLRIEDWYENEKLYGSTEGCRIEWRDLIDWITEHKQHVKCILAAIK